MNAVVADAAVNERTVEANNALREGVKAAQAGDRAKARAALLRSSELDPQSESAWLWLASISEYPEELIVFLNNVLDINPNNARANEWMVATKALLSKTFAQRGIDAMEGGQKELAAQYFDQALEHDQKNTTAWLWLANLSESNEGKLTYLEKVLEFEPENEVARAAHDEAKRAINQALLVEARSAAVAGRKSEAHDLLDAFIVENPDSEDGWILRSHLAEGFQEKIAAFEKVLAINPDNLVARSGLDSLLAIMQTVGTAAQPVVSDEPEAMENTARAVETERVLESEAVHDKSPTQELEFPEAAIAFAERNGAGLHLAENVAAAAAVEDIEEAHETVAQDPFEFTINELQAAEEEVTFAVVEEEQEEIVAAEGMPFYSMGDSFAFVPATPEPVVQPAETFAAYDVETTFVPNGQEMAAVSMPTEWPSVASDAAACPYCGGENPNNAFTCGNCLATLSLADIEMMLANTHADHEVIRNAVEQLEREGETRPLFESELTVVGIGHLNLRNFQAGYDCLLEASQLNRNNVVLSGQVNTLQLRLEEIRQQEEAHDAKPKGHSILVVDDSATVRKLIAGKLEKCGHEVYCAADGVEALEQLDSVIPDLILLDITMPRMDGYQVCKVIRSKESTKDVPVVMISGKDGFFDKVRGRMAGTTGYITKPFGPETLMKAVETYLKGQAVEQVQ